MRPCGMARGRGETREKERYKHGEAERDDMPEATDEIHANSIHEGRTDENQQAIELTR